MGQRTSVSDRTDSPRCKHKPPVDAAIGWTVRGCDGVSLLRARYERQHFPRHTHDTYVIGVNERGAHATWHRGARHVIPAHTLAVVSPDEVHTGEPLRNHQWHYRALYVAPHVFEEIAAVDRRGPDDLPHFPRLMINDSALTEWLLRLHRWSEQAKDELETQTALLGFLSLLVRRHASAVPRVRSANSDPPALRRVTEYLHDHLADAVSLEDLAAIAGLSRYQVIRMFSRSRGLTPYAYLIQIRVERARLLLSRGYPLAVTAQAAGFADQSHLTRVFRRLTGMTPGRYAGNTRS